MLGIKKSCLKLFKQLKNHKYGYCSTGLNVSSNLGHTPVMKEEVMQNLFLSDGETVLDMTFGAGGHTRFLLENYPNLKIIALDRDPLAYKYAKELQEEFPNRITPLLGRFSELSKLAVETNIPFQSVDGVICDLGASSMQMDSAERGFGISNCGPLDMRMDGDRYPDSITAADIVNHATEEELYKIFKVYGQERYARTIARVTVQTRMTYQKFKTTHDVADLVNLACSKPRYDKLGRRSHSATKVFQALRIFVNNELNELNQGLLIANFMLKMGGRIVILSFHSLEDTLAKRHFQGHIFDNAPAPRDQQLISQTANISKEISEYEEKPWEPINKKVILPTEEEVKLNPRSRSAKLRAAIKIGCISVN